MIVLSRLSRELTGRLLALVVCGMVLLGGAGFRPYLSTADVGGERLSHKQAEALAEARRGPALLARSAILYDKDTDQVLFSLNPHERLAPASTTKIATALVVLQRASLEQSLTAGPEVNVEGMRFGISEGESATVAQLLYALLLNSGNDAAMVFAMGLAGDVPTFAGWMNELVASLELRDTHFVAPHGLDAPDHYSSAYDLMQLARAGLQNPTFAHIVAQPEASLGGWTFLNSNELLGSYPGVDGVKTGTTDEAGECLVASATQAGHQIILVVLGSTDRYSDARALFDFYYAHYHWQTLDLPANRFSELPRDVTGRPSYYMLAEPAETLLADWQRPWLNYVILPAASGLRARFWIGERTAAECALQEYSP